MGLVGVESGRGVGEPVRIVGEAERIEPGGVLVGVGTWVGGVGKPNVPEVGRLGIRPRPAGVVGTPFIGSSSESKPKSTMSPR